VFQLLLIELLRFVAGQCNNANYVRSQHIQAYQHIASCFYIAIVFVLSARSEWCNGVAIAVILPSNLSKLLSQGPLRAVRDLEVLNSDTLV